MAKTKISQYDATAANNTDIDSINIAEGMAPSNVNNAIRELMAHLKDMDAGTQALTSPQLTSADINGGTIDGVTIGGASAGAGTFTNLTATGTTTLSGASTSADITFGDNDKAIFGAGSDLQIYHDGQHSYISDEGTGSLRLRGVDIQMQNTAGVNAAKFISGADVQLFHAGSQKLATTSTGINVTGNATFGDSDKAIFGAGSDLQIYHDETTNHSYIIESGTGDLRVLASTFNVRNVANTENMIVATPNGSVDLYYDNAAKLATTSTGIDVTGTVTADSLTVDGAISQSVTAGTVPIEIDTNISSTEGSVDVIKAKTVNDEYSAITLDRLGSTQTGLTFKTTNSGTLAQRLKINNEGDISFYEDTGTTPKFFWDASAESLGIGTDSPSNLLELDAGTGTNAGMTIRMGTGNSGANDSFIGFENSAGTEIIRTRYDNPLTSYVISSDTSGDIVSVTRSGRVGIGTSSPSRAFHIQTADNIIGLIESTDADAWLAFKDNSSTSDNAVRVGATGDNLRFYAGSAEAMRIDASQNLLVGKTINDNGATEGIELEAGGQLNVTIDGSFSRFNRLTSDGDILSFRKDGAPVGIIGVASLRPTFVSDGGLTYDAGFRLYGSNTSGAQAIHPYDGSGSTNGLLDLGRDSSRFKDLYLSGGVYLGGTGAANKLDDYEEGSWTPTTSGDATGTLTVAQGFYRKIGNMVFAFYQFDVGVTFTSNAIGGLPFTVGNIFTASSIIGATGAVYTTGTATSCANESSTILSLFEPTGGTNSAHEPLASGGVYRGNVVYMTS